MGTDIHVHVLKREKDNTFTELKVFDNEGNDVTWRMPYNDRNYDRFGVLAGLRVAGAQPIVPLRGLFWGLPQNIINEFNKGWYHSPTWFDYVELEALAKTPEAIVEWDDDDKYNVLDGFVGSISTLLQLYGIYSPYPGEIIVFMMFDS